MKTLESGKDKIQKICDALRKETIDPAKQEAREIIENAHAQAAEIMGAAKAKVEKIHADAEHELAAKKRSFDSSLLMACRQGIELLKGKIEEELLNKGLLEATAKEMQDPKLIAHIIESFLKLLQERGVEEDVEAKIPKQISARSINALLAQGFLEKLKGKSVSLSEFAGGVQLKLLDRQITIDISDLAVRELIMRFIRSDFRELFFKV